MGSPLGAANCISLL